MDNAESSRRLLKADLSRSALQQLPVGVIVAEAPSGRLLLVGDLVRRLVGGMPDWQTFEDFAAAVPARASGRRLERDAWPLARAMQGESSEGEFLLIDVPGRAEVSVFAAAAPILKNGRVIAAGMVLLDGSAVQRAGRPHPGADVHPALEANRIGAFEHDLATGLIHWSSPTAGAAAGFHPAAPDSDVVEFCRRVHEDDRTFLQRALDEILASGEDREAEYRLRLPDGSIRWFAGRGRMSRDEDGRPRRIHGVVIDISDRKRAERNAHFLGELGAALERIWDPAEARALIVRRLGEFFDADRCWLDELDPGGARIAVISDYARKLPPLAGSSPMSESIFGPVAEQLAAGATVVLDDLEADPRTAPFYAGRFAPCRIRASVAMPRLRCGQWHATLTVAAQTPRAWASDDVALMESAADIAWLALERLRFLRSFSLSEARFRAVAESGILSIAFFGFDGVIKGANDAFLEMVGYSRAELDAGAIGWERLMPPEWAADAWRIGDEIRRARRSGPHEWEFLRRDGTRFWCLFGGALLEDDAESVAFLFDIGERKRAEQALQSLNETLEQRIAERTHEVERRAEQLRGLALQLTQAEYQEARRIAENLHNELQPLLVAAKLRVQALRKTCGDVELVDIQTLLDRAFAVSRALTTEISPPVLQQPDLQPAIEWLADQATEQYGLRVRVTVRGSIPPIPDQLRVLLFQSVRELLLNVAKHADTHCAVVTLDGRTPGVLHATVRDAGIGFDPAAARSPRDSGFGLFSLQERIGWIGGQVAIESAPGRGTAVVVSAPVPPTRPGDELPAAMPTAPPPTASTRIRVLLADDHHLMREGLRHLLERQPDMEVVGEARDGLEAVELARRVGPHVVLMDVNMPRMNGIDATRRIKTELPHVHVIALSMHDSRQFARLLALAGASAYLGKDEDPDALCERIRACGRVSAASGAD